MNLTSVEFETEPVDELFTNLYIYSEMQLKKELELKNGK